MWTTGRTIFRKIWKKKGYYPSCFFLKILLIGCSSSPAPKKKIDPIIPEKPTRKLNLGALELTQKDDDYQLLWSLSSKKSEIIYTEKNKLQSVLKNVEGQFYKFDKPLTSFKAFLAEIDQQKKTLILQKNIELYSFKHKIKLYADKITYLYKEKKILAEGNVKLESEDFLSGPFCKITTSVDLKDIKAINSF